MTWVTDTLPAFKAWLGGDPPATDEAATRALTVALATVETYLDRKLEEAARVQEDYGVGMVLLRAWPIGAVTEITTDDGGAVDLAGVEVDAGTGRVGLASCYGKVTTSYVGGFPVMPADLEYALWHVAAALYPGTLSAAGGGGGGQAVRRITTPDVGTVEYQSASAAAGGQVTDSFMAGLLSPAIEATLRRYRAELAVGGA